MIPYKKDGHDFILIANSSRGVMKLKADNLESYSPIDSPTVSWWLRTYSSSPTRLVH